MILYCQTDVKYFLCPNIYHIEYDSHTESNTKYSIVRPHIPVQICNILMNSFKGGVEPIQYINMILSELIVKILDILNDISL